MRIRNLSPDEMTSEQRSVLGLVETSQAAAGRHQTARRTRLRSCDLEGDKRLAAKGDPTGLRRKG